MPLPRGETIASLAALVPPRVSPPAAPLGRLAYLAAFVRNPLDAIPRAVYEQDWHESRGRVWITDPALIKAVLLDEREKFRKISQIRLLSPLLGRGILTSEGAEWKWQRQAAAPLFRQQELLAFAPAFVAAAQGVVQRWRAGRNAAETGAPVHAIDRAMTRATFEVISETLLPSADAAVVEESMAAFQRWAGWNLLYANVGMPAWMPRPGMRVSARAIGRLRGAVHAMLRERRATGGKNEDLLQRLMAARDPESGQAMDERQLVDNLLTFYLAGHETTARALSWTLYLVARSPEWAARSATGRTRRDRASASRAGGSGRSGSSR